MGTAKRGRTGDSRVVRNSLMRGAGDATQGHGEVLTCPATNCHVWVPGAAAAEICYYQMPSRHPWSELWSSAMLMTEGYAELAPPFFWALWESWP